MPHLGPIWPYSSPILTSGTDSIMTSDKLSVNLLKSNQMTPGDNIILIGHFKSRTRYYLIKPKQLHGTNKKTVVYKYPLDKREPEITYFMRYKTRNIIVKPGLINWYNKIVVSPLLSLSSVWIRLYYFIMVFYLT